MNGILNLNKPAGFTSFDCVAALRRLTGEKKIGHTGTLDPQATGVLPICIGRATRVLEYMDSAPKTYVAECTLGLVTDTQDIWGTVLEDRRSDVSGVTREAVETALGAFVGDIEQRPPVYSAIKVNGRRLYDYARAGETVEVPVRRVQIYSIRLLDWNVPEKPFSFEVTCSRGTYVRSICNDLGEALGCGACLSGLVRTKTCGYSIEDAVSLEELKTLSPEQIEALLDPVESAVAHLPRLELSEEKAKQFVNGNPLWSEGLFSEGPEAGSAGNAARETAVYAGGKLLGVSRGAVIAKVLI